MGGFGAMVQARDDNSRETLRRAVKEARGARFNETTIDDLTDKHINEATINLLGVDRSQALCDWNPDPPDRNYKTQQRMETIGEGSRIRRKERVLRSTATTYTSTPWA